MRVENNDGFAIVAVEEVLLDGVRVEFATLADTELGWVEKLKKDAKGHLCVMPDGSAAKEGLSGNVEIIFAKGWGMDAEGYYHLNGVRVK